MKTTLIYAGIAGYGFESLGKGMEAGWINHGLAQLAACAKAASRASSKPSATVMVPCAGATGTQLEAWSPGRFRVAERGPSSSRGIASSNVASGTSGRRTSPTNPDSTALGTATRPAGKRPARST